MPVLPLPPTRRVDDGGWGAVVAQLVPTLASLVAIGAMSASLGHPGLALVLVTGSGLGVLIQLDLHLRRRIRETACLRREYGDVLAGLAPAADWTEPAMPEADPVCRVLAGRAVLRLRRQADVPPRGREAAVGWGATEPGLRIELAPEVWLDLGEAAMGGDGPHGVIVGATGAGKSELLRTLMLSLAMRHPPDRLTMLGLDFKGGTALGDLADLPHCVGLVTNLESSPRLIGRLKRALDLEIDRRQELARGGRAPVPLIIVIDEFSELLTQHPTLNEVLVRIGRLGRSLGIHLVLASQRLDESRLRELDSHLSWRLALRTFTEVDSRAVLGSPEAATLPREPGWALLRTGASPPHRFRVEAFTPAATRTALADIARHRATTAMPLCLPPLTEAQRLSDLLRTDPRDLPIGVIDHPVHRAVATIPIDHGHIAIIGAPRSGKSSMLLTVSDVIAARTTAAVITLDARQPDLAALDPVLDRACLRRTVLVVDDWSVLRSEHPMLEDALIRAALVDPLLRIAFSASRWADVRPALRDLISTRIELRLPDPLDSLLDRQLAADVPPGAPGQGLIEVAGHPERFLAAIPSLGHDGEPPRC